MVRSAALVVFSLCLVASSVSAQVPCLDALAGEPQYAQLMSLLNTAGLLPGLQDAIENLGAVTIFAPTNDALKSLGPEALAHISHPRNRDDLHAVLLSHLVGQEIRSQDFVHNPKVTALSGVSLNIEVTPAGVTVESIGVIPDKLGNAEGCVVHEVNKVILPPSAPELRDLQRRFLQAALNARAPAPAPAVAPAPAPRSPVATNATTGLPIVAPNNTATTAPPSAGVATAANALVVLAVAVAAVAVL